MEEKIVGISYATEQKEDVENFVNELKKLNISYFYDEENPDVMWGNYAPDVLSKIYRNFKCVVAFVSKEYLNKAYPRFEMFVSFHNNLHLNNDLPYFLPIVYENVNMPSFYRGFFYIQREKYTIEKIAEILNKKLNDTCIDSSHNINIKELFLKNTNKQQITIEEFDTYNFTISPISNTNNTSYCFKYDLTHNLYYVLDKNDNLKAVIKIKDNNQIDIINYSLFASITNELSINEFMIKFKRLLESNEE